MPAKKPKTIPLPSKPSSTKTSAAIIPTEELARLL